MFGHFEYRIKSTLPTTPSEVLVKEVDPKPTALKPTAVKTEINAKKENTPVNTEVTNKSQETEAFDGVLTNIVGAKITEPVA